MTEHQEFDPARLEALEEITYGMNNALETVIQILIDKGYFTQQELLEKMDTLAEHEDTEEIGFDADAPRDQDKE